MCNIYGLSTASTQLPYRDYVYIMLTFDGMACITVHTSPHLQSDVITTFPSSLPSTRQMNPIKIILRYILNNVVSLLDPLWHTLHKGNVEHPKEVEGRET